MVVINTAEGTLEVPDLGVTLRTLLGCAVTGYTSNPKRTWRVVYKCVVIGTVRIKTDGSLRVGKLKNAQIKEQTLKEDICLT